MIYGIHVLSLVELLDFVGVALSYRLLLDTVDR